MAENKDQRPVAPVPKTSNVEPDEAEWFAHSVNDQLRPGAFADNFDRLLGLHRLTAVEASRLLGISKATLSYWRNGQREPNVPSLVGVSEFFEIDAFRLLGSYFPSLLVNELSDVARFARVDEKIRGNAVSPTPISRGKHESSKSRQRKP